MATATTSYPDGSYPDSPTPKYTTSSPTGRSKRKRDEADSSKNSRNTPQARRSSSQQFAAANVEDTNPFSDASIDLSALQQQQSPQQQQQPAQATMSGNVDAATAALNYSMQVPNHSDNFIGSGPGALDHSDFQSLGGHQKPTSGGDGESGAPTTPADPNSAMPPDGLDHGSHTPGGEPPTHAHPSAPLTTSMAGKPAVGSTEWHKVRKDNHKEVERRRRETINEGINELAKIVPGCEKNKGSILQRAVQYIQKLQDDLQANIDKWTFEKLVTEQAIGDLSQKLEMAGKEKDAWKRVARENGVDVESIELRIEGEVVPQEDVGGGEVKG